MKKTNCDLYNGTSGEGQCLEKVFDGTCPGLKDNQCVSKKDLFTQIPDICGLGKNGSHCKDTFALGTCPGIRKNTCITVYQPHQTPLPRTPIISKGNIV